MKSEFAQLAEKEPYPSTFGLCVPIDRPGRGWLDRLAGVPLRLPRGVAACARHIFDRGAALILLILSAPLLLVIALAVKLDSSGPIFYSQVRVGQNRRRRPGLRPAGERRRRPGFGREFDVLKVRSMRLDAEKDGGAVWCRERDPRVTRVGRLLRRMHLDELPQLINVLKGDMRLVGPRPERPEFIAQLAEKVPGYGRRLDIKPGLTGLAQIRHRADLALSDVRKKIRYDLLYARKSSLRTDIKIILGTVPFLLGFSADDLKRPGWRLAAHPAARLAMWGALLFHWKVR